jgi:Mg2+ and Co2+ transporter CorA
MTSLAPDGRVWLTKLRERPGDLEQAITATETELACILHDRVREAAAEASRDLTNEVRSLSDQLGRHQVEAEDMRAHINNLRNSVASLLSALKGAWWLQAAQSYHELAMLINDHTVRGL